MQLTSIAFANQQQIPPMYSCDGEGAMPPLTIADVPEDAQSLVLIVDDPDAPNGTFVHWLAWNIPTKQTEITEDALPSGVMEGKNSMGEIGWIAPCPPNGTHHYRFMLSALSQPLDIPEGAERDTLEKAMEDVVVARAELVGAYSRTATAAA